jgi:putative lipase involved disintegration of autophagic bodies
MLEEAINIVRRANGEVFKNNEVEISDKVNESYEKANPKLENIRTDELDDKILKSSCSAQIVYQNGYVVDITYKLSYTSENQLFAKVFGLK